MVTEQCESSFMLKIATCLDWSKYRMSVLSANIEEGMFTLGSFTTAQEESQLTTGEMSADTLTCIIEYMRKRATTA